MPEFITLADGSLAVKGRNLLRDTQTTELESTDAGYLQTGTTNPMCVCYPEGYVDGKWFGGLGRLGTRFVQPNLGDWTHKKYTFSFNVDKGAATSLNIYPAYLRDIDADLYIRNIMICYGAEDYPYTPAPEIDETVVLT